jgi:hypothetical protein
MLPGSVGSIALVARNDPGRLGASPTSNARAEDLGRLGA